MSEQIEAVDAATMTKAYETFRSYFFGNDRYGYGYYFWNFIGLTAIPHLNDSGEGWLLPERCAKCVHSLAGPYGRIFAKLMLIEGAEPYKKLDGRIRSEVPVEPTIPTR